MDIPDYLDKLDEDTFAKWLKFASFAKSHDSEYVGKEEREVMILDLYQLERGYTEEEDNYEEVKKVYAPFLKQVNEKLSRVVLIKHDKFEWESLVNGFTQRRAGENFAEIVARDLILIEKTYLFYKGIKSGEISRKQKFNTSSENTAFKLALILDDEDFQNYTVS